MRPPRRLCSVACTMAVSCGDSREYTAMTDTPRTGCRSSHSSPPTANSLSSTIGRVPRPRAARARDLRALRHLAMSARRSACSRRAWRCHWPHMATLPAAQVQPHVEEVKDAPHMLEVRRRRGARSARACSRTTAAPAGRRRHPRGPAGGQSRHECHTSRVCAHAAAAVPAPPRA